MAASAVPFKNLEACDLRGRRVRLVQRMHKWPAGAHGTIVNQHPYRGGYVVEVRWDDLQPESAMNFEYFTKDDYVEFLTEY